MADNTNYYIKPELDTRKNRKLGTFHMSSALQEYEVARSNFFTLVVENLGELIHPADSYGSASGTTSITAALPDGNTTSDAFTSSNSGSEWTGQDVIQLSINKAFVPHFELNEIEVKRGNSSVKFADTPSWSSGTLEFQDFVGLRVKEVLMAWNQLAYDPNTDLQGRAADWYETTGNGSLLRPGYKKDCTLIEYTPDFQEVRSWTLKGCWIKSLNESPFDVSNSSGGRQITVNFVYDRAILNKPDANSTFYKHN